MFGLWTLEGSKDRKELAQHSSPEPWRPLVTGVGRSAFWAELSTWSSEDRGRAGCPMNLGSPNLSLELGYSKGVAKVSLSSGSVFSLPLPKPVATCSVPGELIHPSALRPHTKPSADRFTGEGSESLFLRLHI